MYRTKDFQLNSEYMKDWALQLDGNLGKYKLKKKTAVTVTSQSLSTPYNSSQTFRYMAKKKFLKRNKIQERFFSVWFHYLEENVLSGGRNYSFISLTINDKIVVELTCCTKCYSKTEIESGDITNEQKFFLWRIVSTHKSFAKRDEWFGQFPLASLPAQWGAVTFQYSLTTSIIYHV